MPINMSSKIISDIPSFWGFEWSSNSPNSSLLIELIEIELIEIL